MPAYEQMKARLANMEAAYPARVQISNRSSGSQQALQDEMSQLRHQNAKLLLEKKVSDAGYDVLKERCEELNVEHANLQANLSQLQVENDQLKVNLNSLRTVRNAELTSLANHRFENNRLRASLGYFWAARNAELRSLGDHVDEICTSMVSRRLSTRDGQKPSFNPQDDQEAFLPTTEPLTAGQPSNEESSGASDPKQSHHTSNFLQGLSQSPLTRAVPKDAKAKTTGKKDFSPNTEQINPSASRDRFSSRKRRRTTNSLEGLDVTNHGAVE